jgi:hypothetical protein
MTESQLREQTRLALRAQRAYHAQELRDPQLRPGEREHHLISKAQIESAQRVLWFENEPND